eukprot:2877391-Prymnesium_polylepis.1
MGSLPPRSWASLFPQKVLRNHARSQRAGSPLRSRPSAHARSHSPSMDVRCTLRRRQPIDDPLSASSS